MRALTARKKKDENSITCLNWLVSNGGGGGGGPLQRLVCFETERRRHPSECSFESTSESFQRSLLFLAAGAKKKQRRQRWRPPGALVDEPLAAHPTPIRADQSDFPRDSVWLCLFPILFSWTNSLRLRFTSARKIATRRSDAEMAMAIRQWPTTKSNRSLCVRACVRAFVCVSVGWWMEIGKALTR